MNYNRVILGGRLVRDPETRYLKNGSAVANFGIAINRRWKTETGEDKEEATFVDVKVFGKTAEIVSKHLKKGSSILLEGRLNTESWEGKDKQMKSKLVVICDRFEFVGKKDDDPFAAKPERASKKEQEPPLDEQGVPF